MILPVDFNGRLTNHLTESKRLARMLNQIIDREEITTHHSYTRSIETARMGASPLVERLTGEADAAGRGLIWLRGLLASIDRGHEAIEAALTVKPDRGIGQTTPATPTRDSARRISCPAANQRS